MAQRGYIGIDQRLEEGEQVVDTLLELIEETLPARVIHIQKPSEPWTTWAKRISARLFFPPILLWDLTKLLMNKLLGEWAGKLVLPAQKMDFAFISHEDLSRLNATKTLHAEKLKIVTHDKAVLDTVEITYKHKQPILKSEEQYIINFVGNGSAYEDIFPVMCNDAMQLRCNVIGFNLRGVGQSTGRATSSDDLVTDGIAQVQRLLSEGVNPENITLKGHSLGGGISTLVARHFHKNGIKVNEFNGRSFSTLTNVVTGWIAITDEQRNGHHESFGGKFLAFLLKPFIAFGIALVKWEIDAASAFRDLPESHREYMLVRSSRENREELQDQLADDFVIPHSASLHVALKDQNSALKNKIKSSLSQINEAFPLLAQADLQVAKLALEEAKSHLKERKMVTNNSEDDGHNQEMNDLRDRYQGRTANQFFMNFFQRAHVHHELVKQAEADHRLEI